MRDFHYGVFIGRFQPLHVGHQHIINEALKRVETLIVAVGSVNTARTPVNPFTFDERKEMINSVYRNEIATGRIIVIPVKDYPNTDSLWAASVYDTVSDVILDNAHHGGIRLHGIRDFKIALTGYGKDSSSFYLKMFPHWQSIQIDTQYGTINATDIRNLYLRALPDIPPYAVHQSVETWLRNWALTDDFKNMVAERLYYRYYSREWGKGPFLTGDAVVRYKGKILLVTRGKVPGKGLLAMPGGFVNPDERVFDTSLRELDEETGVQGVDFEIGDCCAGVSTADDPKRSLRGRVVSFVTFLDVPDELDLTPPVAADDAENADWYDFSTLTPEMFFEDHFYVIDDLLNGE